MMKKTHETNSLHTTMQAKKALLVFAVLLITAAAFVSAGAAANATMPVNIDTTLSADVTYDLLSGNEEGKVTTKLEHGFTFDGNDKTITLGSLVDSGNTYSISLLGGVDLNGSTVTIKNVNVVGSISNADSCVATFIGYLTDSSTGKTGKVIFENVKLNGVTITQNSGGNVGGLIGQADSLNEMECLEFKNCVIDGCRIKGAGGCVGGLVGTVKVVGIVVENCNVKACSIETDSSTSGGLIGFTSGTSHVHVNACKVVNCLITASTRCASGLVGYAYSTVFVELTGNEVCDSIIESKGSISAQHGSAGLVSINSIPATYTLTGNSLKNVTIKSNNQNTAYLYDGGYNGKEQIGKYLITAPFSIKKAEFDPAFGNNLYNVTVQKKGSITTFSSYPFLQNNLVSIDIGAVEGGVSAWTSLPLFAGCSKLTEVSGLDSITDIPMLTFSGCSALSKVSGLDNVISIGESAFSGCSALSKVSGLDNVTSIGNSAFSGCSALGSTGQTGFYVSPTVTAFGDNVFSNCNNLQVIYGNELVYGKLSSLSGIASVCLDDTESSPKITGKLVDISAGTFAPHAANSFEGVVSLDGTKTGLFYNVDDASMTPVLTWETGESYLPLYYPATEDGLLWMVEVENQPGIKYNSDLGKWLVTSGKTVNLSVYLNTTEMKNTNKLPFTTYNFTYITDFNSTTQPTPVKEYGVGFTFVDKDNWDLVYKDTTALGTKSADEYDQFSSKAGTASAAAPGRYLDKTAEKVFIGYLTITADAEANRGYNKPYTVTLNASNVTLGEGFVCNSGTGIEAEDAYATVKSDYTFEFYISSSIELTEAAYNDGRYTFTQELDKDLTDKPLFYIYKDVFKGSYADDGKFILSTSVKKPQDYVAGYFWNTSAATGFAFEKANTTDATNRSNLLDKTALSKVLTPQKIWFLLGDGDPMTEVVGSQRNSSVIVEDWLNSTTNNTMNGWYFDTPYNVTYNIRPGPYGYNQSALEGSVKGVTRTADNWDSGIQVAKLTNNVSKEAEVVWKYEEIANAAGNKYNNYTSAADSKFLGAEVIDSTRNFEVVSSDSPEGDDVVIKLTGWKLADVNKNNKVNLQDAGRIAFLAIAAVDASGDYDSAITAYYDATYEHAILADCNVQGGDGFIDAEDVKAVNKWLAGTPGWTV